MSLSAVHNLDSEVFMQSYLMVSHRYLGRIEELLNPLKRARDRKNKLLKLIEFIHESEHS